MKATLTLVTAGAIAAAAATAGNAAPEKLTVAVGLTPTHLVSVNGTDPLLACITERTNGEITFDYYPSGQLVKQGEGINAINQGLADITFIATALETDKIPLQGVTMLPGLYEGAHKGAMAWQAALDSGGVLAKEWEAAGVKPLLISALPGYQIMSAAPMATLEDWTGKKVRSTGSALSFMIQALGGVPVELPASDMYTALERGTVDATVLSMSSVKAYNVHEIVKAMSTNASLGTATQVWGIGLDTFNRLTPEQQEAIDACGRKVTEDLTLFLDNGDKGLQDEFAAMGIDMFEFTAEEKAKFEEKLSTVTADFLSRLTSRSLPAEEALAEFKAGLGN